MFEIVEVLCFFFNHLGQSIWHSIKSQSCIKTVYHQTFPSGPGAGINDEPFQLWAKVRLKRLNGFFLPLALGVTLASEPMEKENQKKKKDPNNFSEELLSTGVK